MPHAQISSDLDKMIYTLLNAKDEATVDTYEQYPRFMQYIASDGSICPDEESVEIVPMSQSFIERLIKLFMALVDWLIAAIAKG